MAGLRVPLPTLRPESEIYSQQREKFIGVAGEELFVADTPEEVFARAKAAHPEDQGALGRYLPKEQVPRIFANSRTVAAL